MLALERTFRSESHIDSGEDGGALASAAHAPEPCELHGSVPTKKRKDKHMRHFRSPESQRHRRYGRRHSFEEQHVIQPGRSVLALGAVTAYVTLRGGIKVFHHLRRNLLRQLLIDISPVLASCTAFSAHWLDFGSLLGVHRDGDLILHDNDVDIVVLEPDWNALVHKLRNGLPQYTVRLEFPSESPHTQFCRVYCALGFVDLFGANHLDEGRMLVDCGHGDITAIDADAVLPTKKLEWREVTLHVPREIESVLEQRYGASWRIPRYMDKGADTIEGNKTYAKIFRALSKLGIKL